VDSTGTDGATSVRTSNGASNRASNGTVNGTVNGATDGTANGVVTRPDPIGDLGARSAAWALLRSGFVDVRGTQVHTIRGGLRQADGGADVPHLFIHGLGGGATNWLEVMTALGEDREVITMDLPGFGRTVPPRMSAARVRANARFIPAFMDALGIERAVVHGNSMGGMLTALLAGIAPERIERAVMVSPALPTAKSDLTHLPGPVFRRFAPFVVPGVGSTLLRTFWSRADIDVLMRDALQLTVADAERLSPAMLTIMRDNLQLGKRSPWRVESLAYAVESLVAALLGGRELTEGIHAMPAGTLLVWGDEDALVGRPVVDHVLEQRPDWLSAVLPGVGHVPMMEVPQQYVGIVRAWLEGRPVTDVDGVVDHAAFSAA
jgi:pimeloyl-ACP methyl ester carboxylesterase